ncbi:hypothetical protein PENTCL1PPCAC_15703 [Pristionchus entomophagus]|uniref:G protein-coupled receptor n=1 Tax=Pristionchus entomophagus TaxID=358040 RepID=A0AAV5TE31_9BILA|nr:hypothetical protein PENTCL1PPCAC_15703 [Pristionchus entomophagus]
MFPRHGPIETMNFGKHLSRCPTRIVKDIAVIGIPLNAFLLYLIHRYCRKELGAYKHLLTIFASHDIFLSLVEGLFCVTAYRLETIIGVTGRTFWDTRHIASAYPAFYTLPFYLTNLNFLYQYWAIKRK